MENSLTWLEMVISLTSEPKVLKVRKREKESSSIVFIVRNYIFYSDQSKTSSQNPDK